MTKEETKQEPLIDYVKENIKFIYDDIVFQKKSSKEELISKITIAYRIVNNRLFFNFSILSPEDRFVKAEGRQITSKRLLDSPIDVEFIFPSHLEGEEDLTKTSFILNLVYEWLFNAQKKHPALKSIAWIEPL